MYFLSLIILDFFTFPGGELFAKRRKRADNWVVDESSIGQTKPSAFADKFVAEQLHQQEQFHQQQAAEQVEIYVYIFI